MRLTKHHGLGNDFLVLLDRYDLRPLGVDAVRAVCDRHRGLGADGLLRVTGGTGEADATMHLHNADGSRAEISGNGLACVAQAIVIDGWATGDLVRVATDAGVRTVGVVPAAAARTHSMTVDMGTAVLEGDEPEWVEGEVLRAMRVDMGNPHLVLHVPDHDAKFDLDEIGAAVNVHVPGGANVEVFWAGPGDREVTMQVYERGVGITQACGSGACAVAVAARAWDLAGDGVRVRMPGGPTDIAIGATVLMTTPVVAVASIDYPWP